MFMVNHLCGFGSGGTSLFHQLLICERGGGTQTESYTETSGTPTTLITPSDGTAIGSWKDLKEVEMVDTRIRLPGQKPTYKVNIKNGYPSALFAAASSKYLRVGSVPNTTTTVYIVY